MRAIALVIVALVGAGCTFLVTFDDAMPAPCDGGACDDAAIVDGAVDAHAAADANDASAPDAPDAPYAPCKGLASGLYCADDHVMGYRGPLTDLVTCADGGIANVRACGSAGCLAMKDPFPDTCNECPAKANGNYCGRDFAGFPPDDSDILIGCQGGNVVTNYPCPHGCKSNGSAASCYP
jgi:hypothetical protein